MEIDARIVLLQSELINHRLNKKLQLDKGVQMFMESHVFVVWDFMSILKSLQKKLNPINVPWLPSGNKLAVRVLNEIVLTEESDCDLEGNYKSHFEMYLDAMQEVDASTSKIELLMDFVPKFSFQTAIGMLDLEKDLHNFLTHTFEILSKDQSHLTASVFAFSRELVLPYIFDDILKNNKLIQYPKFKFYLERHKELDGDFHGDFSVQLVRSLCGGDKVKWAEAMDVAIQSLTCRLRLWDSITSKIKNYENNNC